MQQGVHQVLHGVSRGCGGLHILVFFALAINAVLAYVGKLVFQLLPPLCPCSLPIFAWLQTPDCSGYHVMGIDFLAEETNSIY